MSPLYVVGVLAFALCLSPAKAVRAGDEVYEITDPKGVFYVFADKTIHAIDPTSLTVVKNITTDQSGAPLTNAQNESRTWNDAAFVEDATNGKYYVFINEGDIYTYPNGTEYSYVTVIDTVLQEIVGRVQVGALPVHGYSIPQLREFWSHSDIDGEFFVISVDSINATMAPIADYKTNTGHGKLLLDESLYPRAYATNVNEQVIEEIDLPTQTRTNSFNYSSFLPDPTICTGTHSIGYSNISQHAYIECADNMGVFEWNTVTNTFVKFFGNITGYVSVAPGDDEVLVVGYDSNVNVLKPQGPGEAAVPQYTFLVSGDPDLNPVYWSPSESINAEPAGDYLVFLPLKMNTNIHNLKAAAAANASVVDDSYASAPADCTYANKTGASGVRHLLHMDMGMSNTTGLKLAMGSNGAPLTANCGACAPGVADANPADYNASMSGMAVVNFTSVEMDAAAGRDATTTLVPTGAIAQEVSGDSTANQCSYGEVSRPAKRGGKWVATVADFPQSSLYVVDPATQTVHGFVATAPHPTQIAWAPSKTGNPPALAPASQEGVRRML